MPINVTYHDLEAIVADLCAERDARPQSTTTRLNPDGNYEELLTKLDAGYYFMAENCPADLRRTVGAWMTGTGSTAVQRELICGLLLKLKDLEGRQENFIAPEALVCALDDAIIDYNFTCHDYDDRRELIEKFLTLATKCSVFNKIEKLAPEDTLPPAQKAEHGQSLP